MALGPPRGGRSDEGGLSSESNPVSLEGAHMANERGLVISAAVVISGDSMQIKHSWLDLQELRFSLLFWDRLEHPVSQSVQIAQGSDGDFLERSKILQRTIWPQPHRRDSNTLKPTSGCLDHLMKRNRMSGVFRPVSGRFPFKTLN